MKDNLSLQIKNYYKKIKIKKKFKMNKKLCKIIKNKI